MTRILFDEAAKQKMLSVGIMLCSNNMEQAEFMARIGKLEQAHRTGGTPLLFLADLAQDISNMARNLHKYYV